MMEEQIRKSWFKRNWLWFIPTMGCLTLIVLFFLGVGALVFGVTNMISESTPAQYAIEKASENTSVIELLGEPIVKNGMASGNINFSNNTGDADLRIPVSGPKGEGFIRVVGESYDDEWTYEKLYIVIKETNEKINLLEKSLEGD